MQPDPKDLDELVSESEKAETPDASVPIVVVRDRRNGLPWPLAIALMLTSLVVGGVLTYSQRPERSLIVPVPATPEVAQTPPPSAAVTTSDETKTAPVIATLPSPVPATGPSPVDLARASAIEVAEVLPEPEPTPQPGAVMQPDKPRRLLVPTGIGFDPQKDAPKPGAKPAGPEPVQAAAPMPPAPAQPAPVPVVANPPKTDVPDLAAIPPPFGDEPQPPKVDKDEVAADISREAAERRRERQLMEEAKPRLLQQDPQVQRAQTEATEVESRTAANDDRRKFHAELNRILHDFQGEEASEEIQALCAVSPHTVPPSVKKKVAKFLSGPAAGIRREARISVLRGYGYPESLILSDLVDQETRHIGSRGGPSRPSQVLLRAARLLLGYPPRSKTTAATPAPAVPRESRLPDRSTR